jgi:protein-tyrosine phosphatase
MAEFLMKSLVQARGLATDFFIASAATSDEEIGNGVYPPVRSLLAKRGISCEQKRAVRLTRADYEKYDYIVGMDEHNRANMLRLFGGDRDKKVSLLLDFTEHPHDVADPWYTRDFLRTEADILAGCQALLAYIESS